MKMFLKKKAAGVAAAAVVAVLFLGGILPVHAADTCELGKNINTRIKDITIKEYLYGYNKSTQKVEQLPDHTPVTEWVYIMENIKGTLVNDGSLKAGDYFTYQLDSADRLGGFQSPETVQVGNLYVTDAKTGEEVLFAYANLDPDNNKITYILSDYIEGKESVSFELEQGWTIKPDVIRKNGEYTFQDTFAEKPVKYTHTIAYGGNADERQGANTFSLISRILYVNPAEKAYTQIGYLNPRGTELKGGFTVEYISGTENGNYTTPLADTAEFRVYEVPDGYEFPDTFGVDLSALKDVTDTLEVSKGSQGFTKYTMGTDTQKRYVFYLKNNYVSNKELNEDNILVETQKTIYSAFNVTTPGISSNGNHLAAVRILENTVGAYAVGGESLRETYCNRNRKIQVKKTDASNSQPLQGAVFEILKDGTVVETLTTGADGLAITAALPLGDYSIREITAPKGYQLSQELTEVKLESTDGSVKTVEITNQPIPKQPDKPAAEKPSVSGGTKKSEKAAGKVAAPKTGDKHFVLFYVGGMLAAAVLFGNFFLTKRRLYVKRNSRR